MEADGSFTGTSLLAAAGDVLENAGYRLAPVEDEWPVEGGRVYEDPYSIAAVVVFETWAALAARWMDAQAALVELIGKYFLRSDAKVWEGYLVLLTPSILPLDAHVEATELRRNTQHVRKLLATGDELHGLADVERALLPLLPLSDSEELAEPRSALELVPDLLEAQGVSREAVEAVIDAFVEQAPVVERLHHQLSPEAES